MLSCRGNSLWTADYFCPSTVIRVMQCLCVVKGLWSAAQPSEGSLVSAKACIEGLLGLIVRKWLKGDQRPLFHSCRTLWTRCSHPTCPSVCSGCYIPAWMCSFWLVNLRYDILSGVSICACVCVWLVVLPEASLPMEPWRYTIYQVCCWLYQLARTGPPSLQAQILLLVNTNNNFMQNLPNILFKPYISKYGVIEQLTKVTKKSKGM